MDSPKHHAPFAGLPTPETLPAGNLLNRVAAQRETLTIVLSRNAIEFLSFLDACQALVVRDTRADFLDRGMSALTGLKSQEESAREANPGEVYRHRLTQALKARFSQVSVAADLPSALVERRAGGVIALLEARGDPAQCVTMEGHWTMFKWTAMRVPQELVLLSPSMRRICFARFVSTWDDATRGDSAFSQKSAAARFMTWAATGLDAQLEQCFTES